MSTTIRNHRLAVALGLAVVLQAGLPASAQTSGDCGPGREPEVDRSTGEMECTVTGGDGGDEASDPAVPDGGSGPTDWPPPGYVYVEWSSGGSEDDGTPCIRRNGAWMLEEDRAGHLSMHQYAYFRWYESLDYDLLSALTDCSASTAEPALDPSMVEAVIRSRLPLPEPWIAPGRAITGLRSYLEVGAPTTFHDTVTATAPAVTISIDASARYRVDWGDGTVEMFDSAGGTYPDGDISHVYTSVGEPTVSVTPVWTVHWSGGGIDTTVTADLVPSTLELPVGQVQAVRVR